MEAQVARIQADAAAVAQIKEDEGAADLLMAHDEEGTQVHLPAARKRIASQLKARGARASR